MINMKNVVIDFDSQSVEFKFMVENPGGGDHVTRSAFDPL